MATKPFDIKYEVSHRDEWGNEFVYCPVCGFDFVRDGVMKHCIRTAQVGEMTHIAWLEENGIPWNKEQREKLKNKKK